jgi:tRNA pseudouridine synthase 10
VSDIEKAIELGLCDRCLGRQFIKKFPGFSNERIGMAIRKAYEHKDPKHIKKYLIRGKPIIGCEYCDKLFQHAPKLLKKALSQLKSIEFSTFLCGTKISKGLLAKEEYLWEKIGVEYCEPLKKDLLKELGSEIEKKLRKKAEFEKQPDVTIVFNFIDSKVELEIHPLFIYGKYNKLVRGIPQTKWICIHCSGAGCKRCGGKGKFYDESVEEIMGKKILTETKGVGTKFHGAGREDIDALCLGKRPFVIEIEKPKKRKLNFRELAKKINKSKKVNVFSLRKSDKEEVRLLKAMKVKKVYRAVVECDSKVSNEEIERIVSGLKGKLISQRTPLRVAHRRADRVRKRRVSNIKLKKSDTNMIIAEIEAEAGTYVKELISGDSGRTRTSFSSLLGKNCKCVELDVIKVG